MIEKVNPSHPDKLADRIAGAIVDLAYKKSENPKVAVEVLLGHGNCHIIIETSENFTKDEIDPIVKRIAGNLILDLQVVNQDEHLAKNQDDKIRCGDNGIFKGVPLNQEQKSLSRLARIIYKKYSSDGKYIYDILRDKLIVCQSNADSYELYMFLRSDDENKETAMIINPLGEWSGGTDVDSGATNRKLGSDMYDSVTGGGLHGKDLSKADVSINIYAWLKAQNTGLVQNFYCAIGDEEIDGKPYSEIVEIARDFINELGGFEKLAEWGLY